MTQKNKRFLGIGIMLTMVGIFKIYMKGIYRENDEIIWFNLLIPFAMGIVVILYTLVRILREKGE